MSVSVFADPGAFVESPSANGAPVLNEEESDDNVKITAYRNRADELNATQITEFENAYKEIVAVDDLTVLVSSLTSVAENVNVDAADLAVSDLFYVSLESGQDHTEGAKYVLSIQADTFTNFICLLHFVDGEWKIVPEVELKGTKVIEFTAENLGTYAVVVSVGDAPEYPEVPVDDDGVSPWVVVGIVTAGCAVVAGISLIVVIVYKSRHEKDEKEEK